MIRYKHSVAFAVLAAAAFLGACSDSKTVGSADTVAATSETVLDSVLDTVVSTEVATTTSVAATTSVAVTTTTVADVELVLRDGGIGPFDLGVEAAAIVDGVSTELGSPISDDTTEYPVADGVGAYTTTDGEIGFVAPIGRTVCWSISLCVELGGGSEASMSFTGWHYVNDPAMTLSSASGATVGLRWSDLPTLEVDEGGCYSSGSGSIDGIRVTLESSGLPFGSFDDAGNYVTNVPDAADVVIRTMETGRAPSFLYGDC